VTVHPKLRIGVIGVGFGAQVQIPGFQSEGLKVVAVCARHKDRARYVADQFEIPFYFSDYRRLLEMQGLDAVSVVTPYAYHREISEAALEAGKHVICEKPFASNITEASSMRDMARKHQRLTTMIDHEYRWMPQWAYVRDLIEEGYIGQFQFVRVNLYLGPPPLRKNQNNRLGPKKNRSPRNEFLWGIGSHYIDVFRYWFGDIRGVNARMFIEDNEERTVKQKRAAKVDDYVKDNLAVLMDFKRGGWGTLVGRKTSSGKQGQVDIEIFGSEGSLFVSHRLHNFQASNDLVFGSRLVCDDKREELRIPTKYLSIDDNRHSCIIPFRLFVQSFIRGTLEGYSPAPNFEDGYRCQQVLNASVKSAQTGQRIAIMLD